MNARKRLLLIGAGHAHLALLDLLRRQPAHSRHSLVNLDITLLTRELHKPAAGMLAGLIAGHYRNSECHLDVATLAARAGVGFEQARVERLDMTRNLASSGQRAWEFDMVSVNTGAGALPAAVEASAYAIGMAPIDEFLQHWHALRDRIGRVERPVHLVVVGGGAQAVELVLAMAYRLAWQSALVKWSLVAPNALLPDFPRRLALRAERHLARAGVALRTDAALASVDGQTLLFEDGTSASFDALVWAMKGEGPGAQAWLAGTDVACADDGRICVNRHLQSTTHPCLFAAGDVAAHAVGTRHSAQASAPWQAALLMENLRRCAAGQELPVFNLGACLHLGARAAPRLVTVGPQRALASCGGLVPEGAWLWHWNNRRERALMQRLSAPVGASRA